MFEDKLRRRLRRWQRSQPLPATRKTSATVTKPATQRANFKRFGRPHFSDTASTTISADETRSQLDRGTVINRKEGTYLLIQRPLDQVFPPTGQLLSEWQAKTTARTSVHTSAHREPTDPRLEIVKTFREYFPQRAMFLDLETCGLAGAAIFLAGLIHSHEEQLILTQLWARNYAEEAAMIAALGDIVRQNEVLITFNGKSFDWPQVRDRTTRYAAREATLPTLPHFDLLHHCRRQYGNQFGDCRLQTLELHVCQRRRVGDIPGHAIPDVYAKYVRTQDAKLVEPILHHNALDLITLWQLALEG